MERRIGVDELLDGIGSGLVSEVFACGTAVITPIGELRNDTGSYVIGGGETGETTAALRKNLLDIQYGRAATPTAGFAASSPLWTTRDVGWQFRAIWVTLSSCSSLR